MGMFDNIRVEIQIPDQNSVTGEMYQTKSFHCIGDTYVITTNRELYRETWEYQMVEDPDRPITMYLKKVPGSLRREYLTDFHGDIIFYSNWKPSENMWRNYHARFTEGKLARIWYEDIEVSTNNI